MVKVSDMHRSVDFNLFNIPYYYYIIGFNSSCYKDMAIEVIQVFMFILWHPLGHESIGQYWETWDFGQLHII